MSSVGFTQVQQVRVHPDLLSLTLDALRAFGSRREEGLVLWIGEVDGSVARVERALVPPQRGIRSEAGVGYFIEEEVLFALNRLLSEKSKRLLAQVHSHPGEAYHSATDDAYAIVTTEGGFSLVVPNFGEAPADPAAWAVYRLLQGQWIELDAATIAAVFEIHTEI